MTFGPFHFVKAEKYLQVIIPINFSRLNLKYLTLRNPWYPSCKSLHSYFKSQLEPCCNLPTRSKVSCQHFEAVLFLNMHVCVFSGLSWLCDIFILSSFAWHVLNHITVYNYNYVPGAYQKLGPPWLNLRFSLALTTL